MPSVVGMEMDTVSVIPGYCVRCPRRLTSDVSATNMSPNSPVMKDMLVLSVGSVIRARPEMNQTHLSPQSVRLTQGGPTSRFGSQGYSLI